MCTYLPYSPSIMIPCTFWIFHSPWFLQTASFQTGSLLFHASTKNFKLFSCSCNKNANSCINLMNGWKESCSVKENKAKISQSHNQFIYEILWCITLYHTRCVFFSGHGYFQKTLKIRVATKRKRPTGVLSTGEAFSFFAFCCTMSGFILIVFQSQSTWQHYDMKFLLQSFPKPHNLPGILHSLPSLRLGHTWSF